jgi:hypothetical protein
MLRERRAEYQLKLKLEINSESRKKVSEDIVLPASRLST